MEAVATGQPHGTGPLAPQIPEEELPLAFSAIYKGTGTSSTDLVDPQFRRERLRPILDKDDIQPVYTPRFAPASDVSIKDQTFVIGLSINGESRAYPVDILTIREMVNDVVGEVPVLITW